MSRPADASMADEVRALGWLAPLDAPTRAQVLALLRGTSLAPSTSPDEARLAPCAGVAPRPMQLDAPDDVAPIKPRPAPKSPPKQPPEQLPAPSAQAATPTPPPSAPRATLADATTVTPLPRQAAPHVTVRAMPAGAAADAATPLPAAILAASHARAVLSLLGATRGEVNAPDLPALITWLARGRPVTRVPRLQALTTRRGVQLLIDRGAAMAPLAADREQVRAGLVRLLGADRVDTLYFAGCPTRGVGPGARRSWQPDWKAPARGMPVIVIGTLGLVGSVLDDDAASAAEWVGLAEQARAGGNPEIVLSPFGPERWPAELVRAFVWVPWSERLSAAQLNRIRSDAESRGR